MESQEDSFLVSVWCPTYNHELYIRDAIEGFLAQKTSFKYEIIIHDDASTDHTTSIIKEYEERYPGIIRGIYQEKNQYSQNYPSAKWLQEIQNKNCRGKYIAFCEGDDFWVDANKLQKQIDWLEQHPEYSMVAHNAICWNCINETMKVLNPFENKKEILPEEIILQMHGNIPTASLVIRTEAIRMENFFLETGIGDWTLQLYCMTKGKIYYFDRIMSIYRAYHEGSWSTSILRDADKSFDHCLRMIDFLKKFNRYTNYRYDKYIISRIQGYVTIVIDTNIEITKEDFYKRCNMQDKNNDFKFHRDIEEIKRIYTLVSGEGFYDKKLEQFVRKNKKIVLFGAGKFARKVAKFLEKHNIHFEGFAVSVLKDGENEYMGKPVWSMDMMPFEKQSVGIIVAINPIIWYQLIDILNQNQINEYICPYLLN